jgi:hypothetical protein
MKLPRLAKRNRGATRETKLLSFGGMVGGLGCELGKKLNCLDYASLIAATEEQKNAVFLGDNLQNRPILRRRFLL